MRRRGHLLYYREPATSVRERLVNRRHALTARRGRTAKRQEQLLFLDETFSKGIDYQDHKSSLFAVSDPALSGQRDLLAFGS